MARTDTLTNFLTDVAAAIKAKKGDDTAIPAANFDTEITNLSSGGGGGGGTVAGLIDRSITSITIPNGVTKIGDYVFYKCNSLTSITIPDSVTSIGGGAFEGCRSLTNITIPDSVRSIGNSTFDGCNSLTSVTIPDSVTGIGDSAFYNCRSLTSITIPDSVMTINKRAFYHCTSLAEVDFSVCTDIPTLRSSNAFSNTSSSLVIKVPSALVDEWKAATNWATYADKIMGV